MNIRELLERARAEFGDRVFAQKRLPTGVFARTSYAQLYEMVTRLGAGLAALDVGAGTRVAILGENRVEWAAAYLAVLSGAAVGVPLDPQLKEKELVSILEQSGSEVAVVAPSFVETFRRLRSHLPKLREVVSMEEGGAGARGWRETLAVGDEPARREEFLGRELGLDNLAVLLFTSGTTGRSKAAMLTHRNLGANVSQVWGCLPYTEADVFLSLLPLHHTFEATAGMLVPISGGASITYARSFKSKEIIEDIRDAGVTMMCGVPLLYEKMLAGIKRAVADAPASTRFMVALFRALTHAGYVVAGVNLGRALFRPLRRKAGLDTIRMFISGAAPLKPEISRDFYYLGLRLLQGYGLTETSPVASVNPYDHIRFASSGVPIPNVEIRIHEPDADGVGEVAIRGDNVMVGYYNNPALTAEVLRGGWFFTGDAGWLDRDGYVYITGRIKNVIVTAAGKNIHPEEVEAELDALPVISEAAVMPMREPASGREVVGAVIFPDYEYLEREAERLGEPFDDGFVERQVRAGVGGCCGNLADYKRVKVIKIRKNEFPKTTTSKIKRYLFRDGEQIGEA